MTVLNPDSSRLNSLSKGLAAPVLNFDFLLCIILLILATLGALAESKLILGPLGHVAVLGRQQFGSHLKGRFS